MDAQASLKEQLELMQQERDTLSAAKKVWYHFTVSSNNAYLHVHVCIVQALENDLAVLRSEKDMARSREREARNAASKHIKELESQELVSSFTYTKVHLR